MQTLENSRVAKEEVSCSQSVGEQVQALFSITVDLQDTERDTFTFLKKQNLTPGEV